MSRTVLQVYAAVVFGIVSAGARGGEPIQWASDLKNAREAAVAQDKLLLLHFWTPDCGPCKVVDQNVFPLAYVAEAINQYYVPLKVNAYENRDLRDHFQVDRWPTDIIATADGQTISRMVTPQNPDRYVNELMSVIMKQRSTNVAALHAPRNPSQPTQAPANARQTVNNSRWADGIEPPELSENTARAMRPSLDSQSIPGVTPDFRKDVADFGNDRFLTDSSQNSTSVNDAHPPSFAANASRFVSANSGLAASDEVYSPPATANSEIANPYFRPSDRQIAEFRGNESSDNSQGVATYGSLTSGEVANNRGIARDQARGFQPNSAMHEAEANSRNQELTQSEIPPAGLDGRCPVTLINKGTWKKGDPRWGAVHRGNLYLFAGAQEQQEFLRDPDRFSPVLAGMDIVRLAEAGKVVRGSRQFGVLFDDDGSGPNISRIYLFDSVDSRNRFETTPDLFLRPVMEAVQRNALDTLLR